jgi:hypothetical protein
MKRQAKHLLWYAALLVLTPGVAALAPPRDGVGLMSFMYHFLLIFPLLLVPLAFGFMLRSWRQYLVCLSAAVLGWQLSFVTLYRIKGRLSEALWLMYEAGTLGSGILRNCIMPALLVSIGAIVGWRLRLRRVR